MRWWLLLVLAAASCSKKEPLVVDRLEVDAFEGNEVLSMTDVQLRERMQRALEQRGFAVVSGETPRAFRVKLAAGVEEPDPDSPEKARVLAVLHARRRGENDGFEIRSSVAAAYASNDVREVQKAMGNALDLVISEVASELKATVDALALKDEAVVAQLSSSEPAVKHAAIRVLVARHHRAALPPLLEQLRSPDLGVMRAAVGLLVELKAPEAVNPMIEAARLKGPVVEREIVFAAGALGGDDAEAYLDLVASGSDDPLLRQSAERALRELRARHPVQHPREENP